MIYGYVSGILTLTTIGVRLWLRITCALRESGVTFCHLAVNWIIIFNSYHNTMQHEACWFTIGQDSSV